MNNSISIFLLAGVLVVGLVLFAYINKASHKRSKLNHDEFRQRWQRIQQLQSQGETGWQLSIMDADKLLDQALRQSGYRGETMGERLKSAQAVFRDTDAVWKAHKLRNRLAHEQDVRLSSMFVSQALASFEAGLKDLGAF